MMTKYSFTFEQFLTFLSDYCGCTFDASGEKKLEELLQSEASKGHLDVVEDNDGP